MPKRHPGNCTGFLAVPLVLTLSVHWSSLVAQLVKNPSTMRETWVQSLGWEESPGERKGYPLQYSGLENPTPVRRVTKSRTWLIGFGFP